MGTHNRMKKVIELIRVSTEGQAAEDRASIPAQRAANARTAAAYGLTICKTIQIVNVSGAAVLRSSEMQELMRDLERPDIHGVVTREFSRLMRPEKYSDYAILGAFADNGKILYLPDGPLNLNDATGRLMGVLRAAMAGNELSQMKERQWASKEQKRRTGGFAQAHVCLPHGVGHEDGRGWFYKPEATKIAAAYRQVLLGNHNYRQLAERVGVTPRGLYMILRNPIYKGWRIIDSKRDGSAAGRILRADGRQGDRKKIKRAPEEVIRVRVIDQPLISEADWDKVQKIMDAKAKLHWRSNPELLAQYTYNGFLVCSECEQILYTANGGHDGALRYYVCKGRKYPVNGDRCDTEYMHRERLESILDVMFAQRLGDAGFLRELAKEFERRTSDRGFEARVRRLNNQVQQLIEKRQRVLDGYFEGVISRDERDQRLASIDRDMAAAREALARETPAQSLDADQLRLVLSPFLGWRFLDRDEKRAILKTTVPEIHVANYRVKGLYITMPELACGSNVESHTVTASDIATVPRLYLPLIN
jgi:DNA invertase Pin-like site-specific DNA recombinase